MLYGIKDAANLTVKKKASGDVVLYTPYANVSTNEWTADQVYAMAKGQQAIRWDHNKKGTFMANMEVFDLKWLSILAGTEWATGATEIFKRDEKPASATSTIELTTAPATGTLAIFKLKSDNISHGTEQVLGAPATVEDEYSISGTTVTLNATTAPEGTKFVAYYKADSAITAQRLEIKGNAFPASYEVVGDTMIRAKEDGTDEYVQIHYTNCKPIPNFTITMDAANVTNLEITFDLFADSNENFATYTIL